MKHSKIKVNQLMQSPVITCQATDTLQHAAALMWEHDCGVLPVTDRDERVIGMITDRDVCMGGLTQGRTLWSIPVSTAMSKDLIHCSIADTINQVETRMQQYQVRRIPVLDADGRALGILSLNDIARASVDGRVDLTIEGAVATLAAVGRRGRQVRAGDLSEASP